MKEADPHDGAEREGTAMDEPKQTNAVYASRGGANILTRDQRKIYVLLSIVLAFVIVGGSLWLFKPHGPKPPVLVFDNPSLGCRFEYPSTLTPGPNFVRADSGSILTIERHSLYQANREFLAGLPDVLFPQVMIQLRENYTEIVESSRTKVTVDGRPGLEVVLRGQPNKRLPPTIITILIFANDEWAYVVRSYSAEKLDSEDRPQFRRVRETWKFLPAPGEGVKP